MGNMMTYLYLILVYMSDGEMKQVKEKRENENMKEDENANITYCPPVAQEWCYIYKKENILFTTKDDDDEH